MLIIIFFGFSGILTDELRTVLETNLPKVKEGKKAKFSLGVSDPKIGSQISEVTKIPCQSNEFVSELLRGVRLHFNTFIGDLKVSVCSGLLLCFCRQNTESYLICFYITYITFLSCFRFYSLEIWKRPNLVWDIVTAERR